jgi:hypothetical protein
LRKPFLGKYTSREDDLFVWSLFLLGVGSYVMKGIRILGQGFPDYETVMFEDGRKTGGYEDELEIVDLTELLVDAIE